ncbi:MAG TPA: FAD-dependent oxidoreductase [Ktedonobacteraceae bacterium]|nr:FAD-dependent oxidoreductase [Ktedonobacteraceae bacterium]
MTKIRGTDTGENIQGDVRDLSHFRLEERLLLPYESDLAIHASGQRVAVIGAGPAGIIASHMLAQLGYTVTVFEALPMVGGMLAVGIPAYRCPAELVEQMVALINRQEIDVHLHTVVGQDLSFQQLQNQFDAILLAVGLQQSVPLGISGKD